MSRRRTGLTAILAVAAAALAPAGALGGARSSSGHTVVLKNLRFHPASLTIHRGDTVTFSWQDGGTEHNVTFRGFHSRTQGHGSYTVRFTHSGTFNYRCTIHEASGMRARIVVH